MKKLSLEDRVTTLRKFAGRTLLLVAVAALIEAPIALSYAYYLAFQRTFYTPIEPWRYHPDLSAILGHTYQSLILAACAGTGAAIFIPSGKSWLVAGLGIVALLLTFQLTIGLIA